jgi:drug/metabolite transporter (DMT)-like permease
LAAYFINAFVFIIDKYLLASPIPKYHAYAFGVSILSLSSLILIPFGVSWLGIEFLLLALASGACFFIGLMFLYKAVKESDVSVAATQAGVMGAIFTYIFSVLILKETLPLQNIVAFSLLIFGIFLLGKIEKRVFWPAVFSGLFFGLSYVLLKHSFNASDFINGLFWTRMGFVGSAFLSLLFKHVRDEVKFSFHHAPSNSKIIFLLNKALAGIGFVILYFSIRLGNVSIVNALLGFQFMFTFLLATVFREKIPGIKENLNARIIKFKIAGITLILAGLLLLFIQ